MVLIREYQPGDEKGIIKLTKLLFPNFEMNLKLWHWLYCFDKTRIILALNDKNKIIGHWAYLKRLFNDKNKKYKAGLVLTSMIHPQWQGKKIMTKIVNRLFKKVNDENLDFIYGFPNDIFLPIMRHYGFVYIKPYHIYKKKVRSKTVDQKQDKYVFKLNKQIIKQDYNISSQGVCLSKNKNDLNWRYLKKPKSNYFFYEIKESRKRIGYVVFKLYLKKEGSHLHLIDVNLNYKHIGDDFIDILYDFWSLTAQRKGATILSTWKQRLQTYEDRIIDKNSFRIDKNKTFHLCIKKIKLSNKDTRNIQKKDWNIKMGDTEIF